METEVIRIRKKDYKKLSDYKIHPNQPYWELIKDILEEKIKIYKNKKRGS